MGLRKKNNSHRENPFIEYKRAALEEAKERLRSIKNNI